MLEKIKLSIEKNEKLKKAEIIILIVLLGVSALSFIIGTAKINAYPGNISYEGAVIMERDLESEDYDEDSTICDVIYVNGDKKVIVSYPYEEYLKLDTPVINAYEYKTENGTLIWFDHPDPFEDEVKAAYKMITAERMSPLFNMAISFLILALSLCVVLFFSGYFTAYEKSWFMSIMVLATIFAILFPEESANGVNGIWIMLLYLLDTFLNILCELLISKQSRYNFLVSVLVEITEIAICLILMYRFATMVVTLFFWLPIDIISFINWTRHKDEIDDELTIVRRLKGYQEILIILAIIIWTLVVGYFISGLNIQTDFFLGNEKLETIVVYIDACASAVGIANGLFILFRLREQWIAWYICALLESIINIISGQYVLLILKLGYFTNTTYGYIRWTRYIKAHGDDNKTLF